MHWKSSLPRITGDKPLEPTRWPEAVIFVAWLAGLALALWFKKSQLFIGLDGTYMRDLARRQFEWNIPIFSASIDFFQGVGDIFFSGLNFTLLPAFVVGSWFGISDLAKVATYVVTAAELTFSILVFGRALGIGRTQSLAAALLLIVLTYPLSWNGAIYGMFSLVPHYATFVAAIVIISSAFLMFGRRSFRQDWVYGLLFMGALFWLVHAGVIFLVTGGPSLMIAGVSGLLATQSRKEWLAKLGLAAVAAIVFSPALAYLLGLLVNTAPLVAPTELANDRATWLFASILFHWNEFGRAGPFLVIAAISGAAVSILDNSPPTLRAFAITLLTYFAARLMFWTATILFDFWRGPSALYFEFFVLPLYAIFAVRLFFRLATLINARDFSSAATHLRIRACASIAAVSAAIYFSLSTPSPNYGFSYPPRETNLTSALIAELGERPPATFRGRVVTLTGRTLPDGINWMDLHKVDGGLIKVFGNEMRLVGITFFGVPSFFQYGSTMTPAHYAVMSRLLADSGDRQMRGVSTLRSYKPKLFAMLGIRYVITDAPIPNGVLKGEEQAGDKHLFLYHIPDANLGDYSPVQLMRASSATEILNRMKQPAFDPMQEILTASRIAEPVAHANLTSPMVFDGVSLHIKANSVGPAILLLPLEFSRCLTTLANVGVPVLFRANLMLTGLAFAGELHVQISLRTGPFINPTCRLHDFADLISLGIREPLSKQSVPLIDFY